VTSAQRTEGGDEPQLYTCAVMAVVSLKY
jgi:hypothetical protein